MEPVPEPCWGASPPGRPVTDLEVSSGLVAHVWTSLLSRTLASSLHHLFGGEGDPSDLVEFRGWLKQAPSILRFKRNWAGSPRKRIRGGLGRAWSSGMQPAERGSWVLAAPSPVPSTALQPVRGDEPHLGHPQCGLHHHLHPGDGPQAHGVQGQGEPWDTGQDEQVEPGGMGVFSWSTPTPVLFY